MTPPLDTKPSPPRVTVLDARAYGALTAEFAELAARAAEANPHMSPASVKAAQAHQPGGRIMVLTAWADGENRRLLGVWALRLAPSRFSLRQKLFTAPLVPLYDVLSMPVLDRDRASDVAHALVAALRAEPAGPRLVHCPAWFAGGVTARALEAAAQGAGGRLILFERWPRAMLEPASRNDPDEYLRRSMGRGFKKRRTEQRALERATGLSFAMLRGEEAVAALPQFLALEAAGWKGRSGTALGQIPADAAYVVQLMNSLAPSDEALVARLVTREGDPVAMGLLIGSGGTWHYLKTAYDERLAPHSPGKLLGMAITRHFLTDPRFRLMDSGMDDSGDADAQLWGERRAMAHALLALESRAALWPMRIALSVRQRLRQWRRHRHG